MLAHRCAVRALLGVAASLTITSPILANGVCYDDPAVAEFLPLRESRVEITVQNQVAVITAHQEFVNDRDTPFTLTYGFPLPEGASATNLAWRIEGIWDEATVSADPPDSLGGGDGTSTALSSYLGETPLLFSCEECATVPPDSTFAVRITYVQLLPYAFGEVIATYPNDYQVIQTSPLDVQELILDVTSLREIESVALTSHPATSIENDGEHAVVTYRAVDTPAAGDYRATYTLSLDELGLFGMSGWFPEEAVPDDLGRGFFTFIAEPQPDEEVVLDKVFTLMVDRSGSMSGSKIVQARDAATFIVDNLNEGDHFNIVDFATEVSSFRLEHVAWNEDSRIEARNYVATFGATGSTNISGAFSLAVPQFATATDTTANIIIFFTDGRPTTGITDPETLTDHVRDLVVSTETGISVFVLGIGSDVNTSLLSRIALDNDGFAQFLRDDEVEDVITAFYLQIRNPVLLDTEIAFTPAGVVSEVVPDPLPSLYQGIQMIVSGRYQSPTDVTVTLSGRAFGQPISYEYDLALADSLDERQTFMAKIWAKTKIEHLLMRYFASDDPAEREALQAEIIALSVAFGVVSPFTSFTDDQTPIDGEVTEPGLPPLAIDGPYRLLGNRPNPFNPRTTITFAVAIDLHGPAYVRIYDVMGRLVTQLEVMVRGPGVYAVTWDGTYADGTRASSGTYLYAVDFGDAVLVDKMLMIE